MNMILDRCPIVRAGVVLRQLHQPTNHRSATHIPPMSTSRAHLHRARRWQSMRHAGESRELTAGQSHQSHMLDMPPTAAGGGLSEASSHLLWPQSLTASARGPTSTELYTTPRPSTWHGGGHRSHMDSILLGAIVGFAFVSSCLPCAL